MACGRTGLSSWGGPQADAEEPVGTDEDPPGYVDESPPVDAWPLDASVDMPLPGPEDGGAPEGFDASVHTELDASAPATIRGRVIGRRGEPWPGLTVHAGSEQRTSAQDGSFEVRVPEGPYDLCVDYGTRSTFCYLGLERREPTLQIDDFALWGPEPDRHAEVTFDVTQVDPPAPGTAVRHGPWVWTERDRPSDDARWHGDEEADVSVAVFDYVAHPARYWFGMRSERVRAGESYHLPLELLPVPTTSVHLDVQAGDTAANEAWVEVFATVPGMIGTVNIPKYTSDVPLESELFLPDIPGATFAVWTYASRRVVVSVGVKPGDHVSVALPPVPTVVQGNGALSVQAPVLGWSSDVQALAVVAVTVDMRRFSIVTTGPTLDLSRVPGLAELLSPGKRLWWEVALKLDYADIHAATGPRGFAGPAWPNVAPELLQQGSASAATGLHEVELVP